MLLFTRQVYSQDLLGFGVDQKMEDPILIPAVSVKMQGMDPHTACAHTLTTPKPKASILVVITPR